MSYGYLKEEDVRKIIRSIRLNQAELATIDKFLEDYNKRENYSWYRDNWKLGKLAREGMTMFMEHYRAKWKKEDAEKRKEKKKK